MHTYTHTYKQTKHCAWSRRNVGTCRYPFISFLSFPHSLLLFLLLLLLLSLPPSLPPSFLLPRLVSFPSLPSPLALLCTYPCDTIPSHARHLASTKHSIAKQIPERMEKRTGGTEAKRAEGMWKRLGVAGRGSSHCSHCVISLLISTSSASRTTQWASRRASTLTRSDFASAGAVFPSAARHEDDDLPETEGGGTMRGAAGPQHMPRSNLSEFSLGSPGVCHAHAGPLLVDAATGRGKKCCVWDGIRETLEACGEVFLQPSFPLGGASLGERSECSGNISGAWRVRRGIPSMAIFYSGAPSGTTDCWPTSRGTAARPAQRLCHPLVSSLPLSPCSGLFAVPSGKQSDSQKKQD